MPRQATGCFCVSSPPPCERYRDALVLFVGQVVWIEAKSAEDIARTLRQRLPAKLAARVDSTFAFRGNDLNEILGHVLCATDMSALATKSDGDLWRFFSSRFLRHSVRFRVTEAFRGITDQEVEILTGYDSCSGVRFQEFKPYLVHAWRNKDSGQLETAACSGTGPVEDLQDAVEYLRALKAGTSQIRVHGFVTSNPDDVQFGFRSTAPLAGIPVLLRSETASWQALTVADGTYEFTGLTPGSYEISASLPALPAGQTIRKLRLDPGSCSKQDFLGARIGKISGTLLDSRGNPVSGVLVDIEAVPPTKQPHPLVRSLTDDNGYFEHTSLLTGDYVIGVNLETPPNAKDWYGKRVPYLRTYYPDVTDRAAAQVLRIEPSQNIERLEFRFPRRPEPLTVTGTVSWPGRGLARAGVWLMDTEYPADSSQVDSVSTKRDGRYVLIGADGCHYILFAHVDKGDYHYHSELLQVDKSPDKPIRIEITIKEPAETCRICKRFTHFWEPLPR